MDKSIDKKNKGPFRVLDTAHLSAAQNMALDSVLLEAVEEKISEDTIRFLSFKPHSVLIGRFQTVEKEVRESFCIENEIDINRRITGGGALYWDTNDVGWEIFSTRQRFNYSHNIESMYKVFCSAAAAGISKMGVDAKFRPRNDIEVEGRKISGSGGTSIKDAFMFQGTLLVDLNIEMMLKSLRIPVEKLKYKEVNSLKQRITWLSRELGRTPGRNEIIKYLLEGFSESLEVNYYIGELSKTEKEMLEKRVSFFESKKHIYAVNEKKGRYVLTSFVKNRKKVLKCSASIDIRRKIISSVYLSGDFFLYPQRALNDIESVLKNLPADKKTIEDTVNNFFTKYPQKITGVRPEEIVEAVNTCVDKILFLKYKIPLKYFNDIYTVNGAFSGKNKIEIFLIPYCAKKPGCKYRKTQGCSLCNKCSISGSEDIAKKYKIKTYTILSYEHLNKTLKKLKKEGVKYFSGSCCEAFYIKHKHDFERIGLPGILINVENKTCYDLGREQEAYEGKFEGFTNLKLDLLEKIFKAGSG